MIPIKIIKMRLINSFEEKLVINEDNETTANLSCLRRSCNKCKEYIPLALSDSVGGATGGRGNCSTRIVSGDHIDMTPVGKFLCINTVQVHPVIVRKTPKFPSRERHLAIKRKKSVPLDDKHLLTDGYCENGE